jgi:nicotinamidase-related amidase
MRSHIFATMTQTPNFHDPARVGTLFYPDAAAIAAEAATAGLAPAGDDAKRVLLLLIDMQVDFCHQAGSLYVPGAEDDIRRLLRFLYGHAESISHIACSLDSHLPFQIFHPAWWSDGEGRHPEPLTVITVQDVEAGEWRPLRKPEWSRSYIQKLEQLAKKTLVIWPYHVPVGGLGNALDPELWSAVFWHSIARGYQPTLLTKGNIPETEHYSIVRPEVAVDDAEYGDLSHEFVVMLDSYDYVLVAGEAETHCVLETVGDLLKLAGEDEDRLNRIFILRDCMSPVVHPEIDFHGMAVEQFTAWERMGLRMVDSTDALEFPR